MQWNEIINGLLHRGPLIQTQIQFDISRRHNCQWINSNTQVLDNLSFEINRENKIWIKRNHLPCFFSLNFRILSLIFLRSVKSVHFLSYKKKKKINSKYVNTHYIYILLFTLEDNGEIIQTRQRNTPVRMCRWDIIHHLALSTCLKVYLMEHILNTMNVSLFWNYAI